MGWKKGQSGNPSGRPKSSIEFKAKATKWADEALDVAYQLMKQSADERIQLDAAKFICERAYGRPNNLQDAETDAARGKVLTLQAQKLEAEIKLLERESYIAPQLSVDDEQKRLFELRERYPELLAMPGNDERGSGDHEDA